MNRISAMATLAGLVTAVSSVSVTRGVTIENFDNWFPDAAYASWPENGDVFSNPTNFRVQATGYGSAYANIGDPFIIDATGNSTLQLDATVDAGVAGFVITLNDTSNHEWNYGWFGKVPGGGLNGGNNYLLTMPLDTPSWSSGAAGAFDFSNIDALHIGIDPGEFATTRYDVSFNDLSAVGGAANLTFNNTGGTGDGTTWDVGTSQNFNNGTGPATFAQGDNVTFNDTNNGHTNVTINSAVNPGSTNVTGAAAYVFSGTGGIGGTGGLTVSGTGSLTLNTNNSYTGATTVANGATLNVNGSLGSTAIVANGTVHFGANAGSGILARSVASIALANGGVVNLAAPSAAANRTVLVTGALTFGGTDTAPEGKLDLGANDMIVRSTAAATIRGQLRAGLTGSAGITSSAAGTTATGTKGIGYAAITTTGTFDGQAVNAGDVVLKYTLLGDSNLDGTVNFPDLVSLAQSYNGTGTLWSGGDFNYDGATNFADLVSLAQNYNRTLSAAQEAQVSASFVADYALARSLVPEPGVLSIVGLGAIKVLSRRRR